LDVAAAAELEKKKSYKLDYAKGSLLFVAIARHSRPIDGNDDNGEEERKEEEEYVIVVNDEKQKSILSEPTSISNQINNEHAVTKEKKKEEMKSDDTKIDNVNLSVATGFEIVARFCGDANHQIVTDEKVDDKDTEHSNDYEANNREKKQIIEAANANKDMYEDYAKKMLEPLMGRDYASIFKALRRDLKHDKYNDDCGATEEDDTSVTWYVKSYNGFTYMVVATDDYPAYLAVEVVDVLSNIKTVEQNKDGEQHVVHQKWNELRNSWQSNSNKWFFDNNSSGSGSQTPSIQKSKSADGRVQHDTKSEPSGTNHDEGRNVEEDTIPNSTPALSTTQETDIANKLQSLCKSISQQFNNTNEESEQVDSNIQQQESSSKALPDASNSDELEVYCKTVFLQYGTFEGESLGYTTLVKSMQVKYDASPKINQLLLLTKRLQVLQQQPPSDTQTNVNTTEDRKEEIEKCNQFVDKTINLLIHQSKIFKRKTRSVVNARGEFIAKLGAVVGVGSIAVFATAGLIFAGPEMAILSVLAGEAIETSVLAGACGLWYHITAQAAVKTWFWSQEFVDVLAFVE